MWGEIQLHPYVGGVLGGAFGGTLPSPHTGGRGVWGEALENALQGNEESSPNDLRIGESIIYNVWFRLNVREKTGSSSKHLCQVRFSAPFDGKRETPKRRSEKD